MHYTSPKHKRLYRHLVHEKNYRASTLAALYLLTAHRKLWRRWCQSVSNAGIEWATSRSGIETGWDGEALERAARSLSGSTIPQVTLRELADPVEYPNDLLRLVVTAIWIARNDSTVITKIITMRKGKKVAC